MPLRVGFIHPDLGIGGAERLIVDSALGLQRLGHNVHIFTSHHDPSHCFEETLTQLHVDLVKPPKWLPKSIAGRFHILLAHARQLQLTFWLITHGRQFPQFDVFFVDQLSTCIPLLRLCTGTPVLFYCHFPDKLLSEGQFAVSKKKSGWLKKLYRLPMDWLEETTTRQGDVLLVNSAFTCSVFKQYFPSIKRVPRVVYPGINVEAYENATLDNDKDLTDLVSDRPTLVSLNRFEKKKNAALALKVFVKLDNPSMRLVLAGGYEPRVDDNVATLQELVGLCRETGLSYRILSTNSMAHNLNPPVLDPEPSVLFVLNYTTTQRTYLLDPAHTVALLYTPQNEHFGIGPVEAMLCGIPVIAWRSGGPVESVLDDREGEEHRTGWLIPSEANEDAWTQVLRDHVLSLDPQQRRQLGQRAKERAKRLFSMQSMCSSLQDALLETVATGRVQFRYGWLIQGLLGLALCWIVYILYTGFYETN